MFYFFKMRIDFNNRSLAQFWDDWEEGSNIAEHAAATDGGPVSAIYKVVGQRRVIVINEVETPDDMDRIMMSSDLFQNMEIEDMLALRPYANFANDVRARWTTLPKGVMTPSHVLDVQAKKFGKSGSA